MNNLDRAKDKIMHINYWKENVKENPTTKNIYERLIKEAKELKKQINKDGCPNHWDTYEDGLTFDNICMGRINMCPICKQAIKMLNDVFCVDSAEEDKYE